MKKLYMVWLVMLVFSTAGCTIKIPQSLSGILTGNIQEITWTTEIVPVDTGLTMEELTWTFDSWTVSTVEGSDQITPTQSWINDEVKGLIADRKTQPADDTKLTEEDIGLMEQIIQKVQDLGK